MSKVLIIGGTSGMGLAAAHLFNKNGHDVSVASRNAIKQSLAEFEKLDLDFTNESAVENFFKHHTEFDYIVITATPPLAFGPFQETNTEQAKQNFDKFWGMTYVIRYAQAYSKHLKAITAISGAASEKRGAPVSFMAAMSSAMNVMVESLALELAPLRINAVSPALTQTPMLKDYSQAQLNEIAKGLPLKRIASAEEVAEAIYFVTLHPYMNGSILSCDGGARL